MNASHLLGAVIGFVVAAAIGFAFWAGSPLRVSSEVAATLLGTVVGGLMTLAGTAVLRKGPGGRSSSPMSLSFSCRALRLPLRSQLWWWSLIRTCGAS